MRKILKKFNSHSFTLEDVQNIAKRQRINILYYPMKEYIKGYYTVERKNIYRKRYIAINENLPKHEQLAVLLHELVHHFLHVQNVRKQTFYCCADRLNASKFDAEAEAISLILEIPEKMLLEYHKTPFEDISPYLQQRLKQRQKVKDDFGV
jgi:Zn-dependent peptidase ImmA (M78 family)